MDSQVSLGEDLTVSLREFDDALHDFSRAPLDSEERLQQLKMHLLMPCNSDLSDSKSSKGSSRCTSEENLSCYTSKLGHQHTAKLGDTKELENFIADLDKVLDDL